MVRLGGFYLAGGTQAAGMLIAGVTRHGNRVNRRQV